MYTYIFSIFGAARKSTPLCFRWHWCIDNSQSANDEVLSILLTQRGVQMLQVHQSTKARCCLQQWKKEYRKVTAPVARLREPTIWSRLLQASWQIRKWFARWQCGLYIQMQDTRSRRRFVFGYKLWHFLEWTALLVKWSAKWHNQLSSNLARFHKLCRTSKSSHGHAR
jgi:hypothetical protein